MRLADQTVCVVGLGLMGGSLAIALSDKVRAVRAVDPNRATLATARDRGLVRVATPSLEAGVSGAQIVVLAAPVRANLALLAQLGNLVVEGTLVLDLSSTKRAIVDAMDALPASVLAVGGHPMCGKERSGLGSADADLFRGRTFVLCETARSGAHAMETADALVRALGARPLVMGPDAHDRAVARVSHLPYLLSAALVGSALELDAPSIGLAASGYRDVSRLAACDPAMMADVLLTNTEEIGRAIDTAQQQLQRLAALIECGDASALQRYCGTVQAGRDTWWARRTRDDADDPAA